MSAPVPWAQQPWSDNPNAPKIPHYQYVDEKATFAGTVIGSILYGTPKTPPPPRPSARAHSARSITLGIVVTLFFKCMAALLKPIHLRGDGVKWGLVSYTMAMFSFVTVFTATNLIVQSNSFIDNREFGNQPLASEYYSHGPLAYQSIGCPRGLGFIPSLMFFLNYWLADGLLVSSSFCATFARSVSDVGSLSSIVAM